MLCGKKTFNFESFEFPSLELKNIFSGVYPHQTRAPYTPCIPPNFKGHIGPSFPQGVQEILLIRGLLGWKKKRDFQNREFRGMALGQVF